MKKTTIVMAVLVASALAFGGESFARGGGGGGGAGAGGGSGAGAGMGAGGGRGQGAQTMTQTRTQSMNQTQTKTQTQSENQVRPEGSQRRDGSFVSTGTTANGSTTRPDNGRGVMDGTGINHPQNTTP